MRVVACLLELSGLSVETRDDEDHPDAQHEGEAEEGREHGTRRARGLEHELCLLRGHLLLERDEPVQRGNRRRAERRRRLGMPLGGLARLALELELEPPRPGPDVLGELFVPVGQRLPFLRAQPQGSVRAHALLDVFVQPLLFGHDPLAVLRPEHEKLGEAVA